MFLESIDVFSSGLSTIPEKVPLSSKTDRFKEEFLKEEFLLLSINFGNIYEVVFTVD